MVADSEIAISITKHVTATHSATVFSYFGKLVLLNALVFAD
jgi:hypothetical protein